MASLCWLVPTLLAGIAGPGIAPAHAATQPGYNQVGLTGYTGLARGRPTAQGTPGGPLAGLALELRLLRLLGGELAFNLAERAGERDFACLLPSYRLTMSLAIVPQGRFDLLLRLGLGARAAADLLDVGGETTSYHFGTGMMLALTGRIHLAAGLLVHLPGATSVQQRIGESSQAPRLREMVNLQNLEATVGLGFRL